MNKFCANCGSPLEPNAKFCANCGTPVNAVSPPASPPSALQHVPAASPPSSPPSVPQHIPAASPSQGQPPVTQHVPAASPPQGQPLNLGRGGVPQPMQAPPQAPWGVPNPPGQYNQYGPHQAQNYGGSYWGGGAYVPDNGLQEMFLRWDNRLNRKPYILRSLALFGVTLVLALILTAIGGREFGNILASLVGLVGTAPAVMLMIRRLHDLDRPGWWAVGAFIPLINMALSVYLLFFKGTPGDNRYGPDPLGGQSW